ncbi:MAG TPA: hypothetical protein VNE38_12810 [Ktedonobacteraceae bacterium]|nr:hypothetical protein [Ktedonobacteraceae bacterium]
MRLHYLKYFLPALIILFCCVMLSACDPVAALSSIATDPPPTPIGVTPMDTSAETLIANVTIVEDQDATDGTSNITLQFQTHLIEDGYYVIFDDQNETVLCNGVTVKLSNAPNYQFHVQRGGYSCTYSGNTNDGDPLAFVPMFNLSPAGQLSPQQPVINSHGYIIRYSLPSSAYSGSCKITATASDNAGDSPVNGSSESANQGLYNGPDTSSLQKNGEVLLIRTCNLNFHNPFYAVNVTYISRASVEVTWTH